MNNGVHLPAVVAHQNLRELARNPRRQRVRLLQVRQVVHALRSARQHLLQRPAMQGREQVPLAAVAQPEALQLPLDVAVPADALGLIGVRVAQTVKARNCLGLGLAAAPLTALTDHCDGGDWLDTLVVVLVVLR